MPVKNETIRHIGDYEYQKNVHERQRRIYEDTMRLWESFDRTCTAMDARFDRALFTIAAGSFGLSFAFTDKFVTIARAAHPALLIASWGCFAGCLIVMVIGHLLSAESYRRQRDKVARDMYVQFDGKTPETEVYRDTVSPCNYISLVSYTGGIVCLLLFVLLNL